MAFQVSDSLSFERLEDGSVKIRKAVIGGIFIEQTLDAFTWCSVVTEMALKPDAATHVHVNEIHLGR